MNSTAGLRVPRRRVVTLCFDLDLHSHLSEPPGSKTSRGRGSRSAQKYWPILKYTCLPLSLIAWPVEWDPRIDSYGPNECVVSEAGPGQESRSLLGTS
jgi:hypothetical protein